MAKETLTVEIRAQADKAIQEMRRYNDTMKKSAERVGRLTKMVKAYWAEALIAIAAIKKLSQFIKSLTDAYIADEKAEALLNSTLKATGIWTETLSRQLTTYADKMQEVTAFSNDQTMAAQGIMATFTQIGTEIYPEVTEAAMNMSTVFGGDLSQAMVRLGKVINDPRMAAGLREIGITMSEQQMEMIKYFMSIGDLASAQRIILDELQVEMGNTARAVGETFGGQVEIATNLVDKWKAAIGELLAEQAQPMIEWLIAFLKNMENLDKVKKIVKALFGTFAAGMAINVATIKTFMWSLNLMSASLVATAIVMKTALNPKEWGSGKMKAALNDLKTYVAEMTEGMTDSWKKAGVETKKVFDTLFKDEITNIDTFGWVYENAMQRARAETDNTADAIKKATEYVIEWRDQMAMAGLDASFYINQQRDMRTGIDEITEAMEKGDDVIMTYSEHIGLLSEQIHDLTELKDILAKQEKENMDILNEQMGTYFPMWSQMFAELGDSTISAAEAMGKALKNMVADYLMSLSKQAFAEALLMIGDLRFARAAAYFVASAAAAAGAGYVRSLATGGQFVTAGPELIMVGEQGAERVTVEPMGTEINNSLTMPLTIQFGNQTIQRQLQWQFDHGGLAIPQRLIV